MTLIVVQPGQGREFWQPVPANGFVRCLLASQDFDAQAAFAMGTQTVAAGCFVREHLHPDNEEVILVIEGHGEALLDGTTTEPMQPGTCLFIGRNRLHRFQAADTAALTFMWLMMPGGLETFFARIGREKQAGALAPAPFARPVDVLQIEAETVFGVVPPRR